MYRQIIDRSKGQMITQSLQPTVLIKYGYVYPICVLCLVCPELNVSSVPETETTHFCSAPDDFEIVSDPALVSFSF